MKKTMVLCTTICFLLLVVMGCAQDDSTVKSDNNDSSATVEKSFNFTMSSYPGQQTASNSSAKLADFTADQIMTGQLTALNTDTSTSQTFNWSVYFDEETWEVESNKTIILTPGNYAFSLLLTEGDYQYAGTAVQEITDGTADVPLTIRPIIGDTIADVSVVAELANFKFQYDPTEIFTAGFMAPQLGIIVDSGLETIYFINPSTGISNNYINLPQGSHQIQLKLYDGSLQKGRSVGDQETVIVTPGLNIVMNLVALHGETTFALSETRGDAFFEFTVPSEVIEEAGGISNLETLFSLVSPNNPLQENLLNLTENISGDYEGEVTLSGMQFDEVTLSLTFNDISQSPKELLGSCNQSVTLNTTQSTVNCDINLSIRAIATGSLLTTLGINVFNEANEPLEGAIVYDGETILGITGSGAFGTSGYLKVILNAGNYLVRAEDSNMFGEENVSLPPLGIVTQDISLNRLIGEIFVSAISGNTTEAGGTATFTVKLNDQPTHEVILGLSSSDTSEGTVNPTNLTFNPFNWDIEQTVTVSGVDDFIPDGDISYSINLAASVSDDANFDSIDPADISVTNTDDDPSCVWQYVPTGCFYDDNNFYIINSGGYCNSKYLYAYEGSLQLSDIPLDGSQGFLQGAFQKTTTGSGLCGSYTTNWYSICESSYECQ